MGRLVGRLFVGFTLFLITFIGYSSQIFIIWPWYGSELSVELLSLLLPFKCVLYVYGRDKANVAVQCFACNAAMELLPVCHDDPWLRPR